MPGQFLIVQTKPPLRDVLGRFAKANAAMLEESRAQMRQLGRRWIEIVRAEAPRKTGDFAKGHIYRTFIQGNTTGFRAYAPQPLSKWIIEGTKRHSIAAVSAGALYFFWPKVGMFTVVPKKGGFRTHVSGNKLFIGKGYVMHPGTKPNDYLSRALATFKPEADASMGKIARSYVMGLKGGK